MAGRVASRRAFRGRAHTRGKFGFDTALGGNALAKRRPWRERADTEVGVARGIAARVRRETGEDVARLDVENVRTLNGTREDVATAAAWEERVNDGGLAFFRDLLFARARGHCGDGETEADSVSLRARTA
jgi:hypothetical protein